MICVPGQSACTASASTCAKSCRASSSASSSSRAVTSASSASPSKGRLMSRNSPSTRAAIAALARPGPIAAATSAGVEPCSISRTDPSGRLILSSSVMSFVVRLVAAPMAQGRARLKRRLRKIRFREETPCRPKPGGGGADQAATDRPRSPGVVVVVVMMRASGMAGTLGAGRGFLNPYRARGFPPASKRGGYRSPRRPSRARWKRSGTRSMRWPG